MRRLIVATALLLSIVFHAGHPAQAADPASPDDTARFLAGMPVGANSPLLPLVADSSWQQHAKLFDDTWKGLDERQLSNIRAWTAKNITDARMAPTTLVKLLVAITSPFCSFGARLRELRLQRGRTLQELARRRGR